MSAIRIGRDDEIEIKGRRYFVRRSLGDDALQLEAEDDGELVKLTRAEILSLIMRGQAYFDRPGDSRYPEHFSDLTVLSEEQQASVKRKLGYIRAVMAAPQIRDVRTRFDKAIAGEANRTKDANKPSWKSVYRWWKSYRDSGEDERSLIARYDLQGNRSSRLPAEVMDVIGRVIDETYLTPEKPRVTDLMSDIDCRLTALNASRPADDQLENPSLPTLYRMVRSIPKYVRLTGHYGKRVADRETRDVGTGPVTTRPLERVEIDHTVLDVIVCDDTGSVRLGRPYLTMIIDHYSRMPLGYYVGFKPPSKTTVMLALRMAIAPKDWIKEKHPSVENDWPCFGVPETIVTDNGLEFHSKDFEAACLQLGINIHHNATKEPWAKGVIERFFGEINRCLLGGIPGKTFHNTAARGEYKSLENAKLPLRVMEEMLCRWLVDYHARRPHSGIEDIPVDLWNKGTRESPVRVFANAQDLAVLLPAVRRQRKIHSRGIVFANIWYSNDRLMDLRRSRNDDIEVTIKVNPEDLGEIIVIDPDSESYFTVPAVLPVYASGLGLWQHQLIRKITQKRNNGRCDWQSLHRVKMELYHLAKDEIQSGSRNRTHGKAARFMENISVDPKRESAGDQAASNNSESRPVDMSESEDWLDVADWGEVDAEDGGPDEPDIDEDLNDGRDDEVVSFDMEETRLASSKKKAQK